tara:strand:+ start:35 stop:403 length:369 start_codon:yes stop_codon:yes gene_type:complete
MPIYGFLCSSCGATKEKFFKIKDCPKEIKEFCCKEDSECVLKKTLGNPMFVNIVNSGSLRGGVRNGSISDDQLQRRTEQLTKRASDHDKSKKGQEQRDKTWERINKKYEGNVPRSWFSVDNN